MADSEESFTRGYYQKPHPLRADCLDLDGSTYKLVDYVADLTMGWSSRWVLLSHDEIIAGKRRTNGAHMADLRSGLKDKKTIKKAVEDALAHDLIEVLNTHLGTAYAIHRRYWALAGFLPKWALYGRMPYTAASDPIPEIPAGGFNPPERESEGQDMVLPGGFHPPSGGIEATWLISLTHLPVVSKQPAQSPQAAQEEARREPIDTSLDTVRIDTKARFGGPSAALSAPLPRWNSTNEEPGQQIARTERTRRLRPARQEDTRLDDPEYKQQQEPAESRAVELPAQDLDALQQRQVAKHALQKLLAEQEQLQALLPSQRGWGAAQGRLRAIAREIEYLQAEAAPPATAASPAEPAAATGKAASTQARISPVPPSQARATPALSGQVTQGLRLTMLQEELAHLKKTPSMQLLARQRIPRLEAEIKQLIAQMQESA